MFRIIVMLAVPRFRFGFIFLCSFAVQAGAATLSVPVQYGTIQAAITDANPGDIILVAPGTYHEAIDFSGKELTVASHFLEYGKSADIASTIITPPPQSSGVTATSGETTNSRLIGFTITGCAGLNVAGVYCYGGSLSILNNRILSNECRGVILFSSRSILRNNEVHANPNLGPYTPANAIHSSDASAIIEQNQLYAPDPNGNIAAVYFSRASDTNISGLINSNTITGLLDISGVDYGAACVISHNLLLPGNDFWSGISVAFCTSDVKVRNNTVIGGGIFVQGYPGAPDIRNNIIAFAEFGIELSTPSEATVAYNNVWGCTTPYTGLADDPSVNGNTSVDPRFKRPRRGDYRLTRRSRCIDAADAASPLDPDGTRADQGAFYFPHRIGRR